MNLSTSINNPIKYFPASNLEDKMFKTQNRLNFLYKKQIEKFIKDKKRNFVFDRSNIFIAS